MILVASLSALLAVGLALFWITSNDDDSVKNADRVSDASPAGLMPDDLGVPVGLPSSATDGASAPVQVDIYYDLDCEACALFFADSEAYLETLVQSGRVAVVHHPVAFLAATRPDKYSLRALAAAACVLDQTDGATFGRLVVRLLQARPPTGEPGLSNGSLAHLAEELAPAADVSSCIDDEEFVAWADRATTAFMNEAPQGINTVPAVFVNGTLVEGPLDAGKRLRVTPTEIQVAIESADQGLT